MKKLVSCLTLFLCVFLGCSRQFSSPREVRKFTEDWRFHLGDSAVFSAAVFDDSSWRTLNLPHDWSIEGAFSPDHPAGVGGGALPGGIGWYRKTFKVLPADSGKCFFIDFDGAYMNSEVWINDHYLGKRPNGYIGFRYDITSYLHFDERENVIAVRVDNSAQPNSRWYSGSGIYRNVWLTKVNPVHVDHWGTFVISEVLKDHAKVSIENTIRNSSEADVDFHVELELLDRYNQKIGDTRSEEITVKAGQITKVTLQSDVHDPDLWSPQDPALYKAVTKVFEGKELADRYETVFGIRSFHFSSDKGFFLNGQPLKINGVCMHHDLGALGAAVNYRAIERQMEIMKGMGVNAIRTSHNPPAP
jgi:beta-galactosidase